MIWQQGKSRQATFPMTAMQETLTNLYGLECGIKLPVTVFTL